jgi:plastin-1
LGIAAAKGLGVKMIGIDARDFINKTPHLLLGVIWQVNKMYLTKKVNLSDTPEIMRLAQEGEELSDLLKLNADVILIRWINYHCE